MHNKRLRGINSFLTILWHVVGGRLSCLSLTSLYYGEIPSKRRRSTKENDSVLIKRRRKGTNLAQSTTGIMIPDF